MIGPIRITAWIVLLFGALITIIGTASLLSGGSLVEFQGVEFFEIVIAATVTVFAWILVKLLRPDRLKTYVDFQPILLRIDELPYSAPSENLRFYGILTVLASSPLLWLSNVDFQTRIWLVLSLPFGFLLGWIMTWMVLGFHFINPFARMFPRLLVYGALLFHFFGVLNAVLGSTIMPFIDLQSELPFTTVFSVGSAVAASQFLRAWMKRNGIVNAA